MVKNFTDIIEEKNLPKYIEYRNGLLTSASSLLASKTIDDETKKGHFVKNICNSKDIKTLLFETELIRRLDQMDGMPKVILTIISKYFESCYLSQNNIQ